MKNKRGLALEMAISTMLIVFALCMLLLTVATYMQKNDSDETVRIRAVAELDQVGEDFYTAVYSGADFDPERYGDYNITISSEPREGADFYLAEIKHKRLPYGLCVTVKVTGVEGERRVSRYAWKYL